MLDIVTFLRARTLCYSVFADCSLIDLQDYLKIIRGIRCVMMKHEWHVDSK